MLKIRQKGQTSLEYAVLVIIIIGALIGMQNYFKRGLQGRWKATVDDLGDQYDPRTANTTLNHILRQNTTTIIRTQTDSVTGDIWTQRLDFSNALELKTGNIAVGAY